MIDLHTHTTASDGRCTPADLVARASAAGVTVLSVTDHDTTAGCDAAETACGAAGILFVPGIEITAILDERDIHVLGYFIDRRLPVLNAFLESQRRIRIDRVREMVGRLKALGKPLDVDAILQPAIDDPTMAVGRPWIARALVAAGHVSSTNEAFRTLLVRGKPGFVPRLGPTPDAAFARIHEAGGIASLAHPGLVMRDDLIPGFAAAGLDAIEAYHSEHDPSVASRYVRLAASLGLDVSGGSDYHGDNTHGASKPGSTSLPAERFEALSRRKRH